MTIKLGSVIISKAVWIRLCFVILLVAMPAVFRLPFLYFPAVSFPAILLASRATRQFRIDNGYEDEDDAPAH